MFTLGVIPARGGSKQIANKNLKPFNGEPLIVHSIRTARSSIRLSGHCVTTDSPAIAEAARDAGVEMVVDRPAELASDRAHITHAIRHAVEVYEAAAGRTVDAVARLFPTFPLRRAEDVDAAVAAFEAGQPAHSLTTVHAVDPRTHLFLCRIEGGRIRPIMGHWPQAANRQEFEPLYLVDGSVDIVSRAHLFAAEVVLEDAALYHVIPSDRIVDIDDAQDWHMAEALLAMREREEREQQVQS